MLVYLARRHLGGMSAQEWDDLPWHEAQMYIEGMKQEGILGGGTQSNGSPGSGPAAPRMDLTSGKSPANYNRRVVTAG